MIFHWRFLIGVKSKITNRYWLSDTAEGVGSIAWSEQKPGERWIPG